MAGLQHVLLAFLREFAVRAGSVLALRPKVLERKKLAPKKLRLKDTPAALVLSAIISSTNRN